MTDLDTLRPLGLVLRETDGILGVDLLAFVLVTADRGYLTSSTGFATSSHLMSFTLLGDVEPAFFETLDYFTPTLGFDPQFNTIFFPNGGIGKLGVYVLNAGTGELLTPDPIPTTGRPTDLVVIAGDSPGERNPNDLGRRSACHGVAVDGRGRNDYCPSDPTGYDDSFRDQMTQKPSHALPV